MQRYWFRPILILTIVSLIMTGQVGRVVAESGDAMSPRTSTSVGGSVCGLKFNDLNGNGVQESNEPGLSGFVFELLDAGGTVVALSPLSAINPLGTFCFTGIAAGTYTVREKPKTGWNLSYPPGPGTYSVTFGAGSAPQTLLFGNTQLPATGSACGFKFNDVNANGVRESTEPGLSGFVFELLDAGGNVVALSTLSAINPLGEFCFNGIAHGTYTVREKPKSGWNLSYPPAPGTYSVTFGYGIALPNLVFGNTQAPAISSVCGIKFNDLNGNGVQESTEPELSGFVFELLDAGGNVVALSTLSSINPLGQFCFNGMAHGTYTVREKPKSGWTLTYPPAPGTYSMTLGYGTSIPNLVFGNTSTSGSGTGTPVTTNICGTKFNDLNGNGIQDSIEPGLSGFIFELLDTGGNVVGLSTLSAINPLGEFCFNGIAAGSYTVREKPKLGWDQTYPPAPGTYSLTVGAGTAPPNLIFGNMLSGSTPTASSNICGVKFNDVNGNGVQEASEPFLADWTFQLLDTAGNVVDTAITSPDGAASRPGRFCFDNVKDGSYTVKEVDQAGWVQTVPGAAGTYSVSIGAGTTPGTLVFGNTQVPTTGSACGTKFEDLNGNGVQDRGEPGLGGWTIQIKDEKGNVVATVVTRDDGSFCFERLSPGSYTFAEVMQPGWQQTLPGGTGTYTVELTAAQLESQPLLFGNMQVPVVGTVCGVKFDDKNGNGRQDSDEFGLDGWTIQVKDSYGNVVSSMVTDRNGKYCVKGLRPDVYSFGEVMQDGYQQTFPDRPGTHSVRVVGGQTIESIDFGNQKTPESCCLGFTFQGGRADNFSTANTVESAQPSAALVQIMPSTTVYSGFDGSVIDRKVAHTFALPSGNCVESARLEFKAKPLRITPATSVVDSFGMQWETPVGGSVDDWVILLAAGTPVWGGFFGNWNWFYGLLPSSWEPANFSAGRVFSYDLANLPGGINLLPTLNAQRSLDFVVEDDTSVDYALLTVTFCECVNSDPFDPFDPKPIGDSVNRPRPPSAVSGVGIRLVVDSKEASVNGEVKRLSAPAVIRDGSTLLPFRGFGDVLGATVQWDMNERRATYLLGDSKVEVWIGKTMARVNGEDFTLSIAPILIDGTTYVPVRSIVEALGLSVEYDPADRSIQIFYSWDKR